MRKKALIAITLIVLGAFLWEIFSVLLFDSKVDDTHPDIVTESENTVLLNETDIAKTATTTTTNESTIDTKMADPSLNQDRFPIVGTAKYPASGFIRVIETPEEQIIRYEAYDGTVGPDLYVYLAKDLDAIEYIDLGLLRSNSGSINYGVPLDVDLNEYTYVLTWCKSCGMLYDYAKINE